LVLHVGFSHILFNIITQLLFGSMLEGMIGFNQMAKLYIVSGVGGNLFSAFCRDDRSVGASTADFGILAGLLAMILVNWHSFDGSH
jgi:rhomboid protease GluP